MLETIGAIILCLKGNISILKIGHNPKTFSLQSAYLIVSLVEIYVIEKK